MHTHIHMQEEVPEEPMDSDDDTAYVKPSTLPLRKEVFDYNNFRCSRCHKVRVHACVRMHVCARAPALSRPDPGGSRRNNLCSWLGECNECVRKPSTLRVYVTVFWAYRGRCQGPVPKTSFF